MPHPLLKTELVDLNPPDVIRLRPNGTLYTVDGSSLRKRLRTLFEANLNSHPSFRRDKARVKKLDQPVVICHRETIRNFWRAD